MNKDGTKDGTIEEKAARAGNGMAVLIVNTLLCLGAVALILWAGDDRPWATGAGIGYLCLPGMLLFAGLKVLKPQEALVLTLFGAYQGTLRGPGFFFVNPFTTAVADQGKKKLSLKALTLNNDQQKINDKAGNPIIIGIVAVWRVVDTAKAVFNVDNYPEFLSIQCDSALRDMVTRYPYDVPEGTEEGKRSLRGSSREIAEDLRREIQGKVEMAGLEILEARITHLSYAQEIAAAMLQRQQAQAVIDARQIIVDGAVGMVEMALAKLSDRRIVELDEERKAAMVSNLLVVLCSSRDTQPVVNSGSLY